MGAGEALSRLWGSNPGDLDSGPPYVTLGGSGPLSGLHFPCV